MKMDYNSILKKALITFVLMLGLIFACATALLWYYEMPLSYGITAAVIIVFVQYLMGPIIINILYQIDFTLAPARISRNIYEFVENKCKEIKITAPELGIIVDGNPNAFTFGYSRRFAKIVLTTGIIEKLSQEELESVILHELGHIKHNDFIIMTIISVIPILMYQIYAWTKNSNKADAVYWIGIGAYGAYVFSQYIALSFSRLREYYADHFSREHMGSSEYLKSALIKIAYGCVNSENKNHLKSSAIGISDVMQAEGFTLSYANSEKYESAKKVLLNWDINSIWGKWYEINSTHPLTAKRIFALNDEKYEAKSSYIKEIRKFILEAFISVIPWVTAAAVYFSNKADLISAGKSTKIITIMLQSLHSPLSIAILGLTILIKFYYSYSYLFQNSSILGLLSRLDASPVKGIPAILKGKIIGKGIPGLFYSEDLVLDDGTSFILIDYRQPMRILEFLFGVLKADEIVGKDVEVTGWYKRGHRPYFVCNHITLEGKKVRSYNYIFTMLLGYALILGGLIEYIIK